MGDSIPIPLWLKLKLSGREDFCFGSESILFTNVRSRVHPSATPPPYHQRLTLQRLTSLDAARCDVTSLGWRHELVLAVMTSRGFVMSGMIHAHARAAFLHNLTNPIIVLVSDAADEEHATLHRELLLSQANLITQHKLLDSYAEETEHKVENKFLRFVFLIMFW